MRRFFLIPPGLLAALLLPGCETPAGPSAPAELGYLWARALADPVAGDWNPDAPCSGVSGVVDPDGLLTDGGLFDSSWRFYYRAGEVYLCLTVDPSGGVTAEEVSGSYGAEAEVPESLDSPAIMELVRAYIEEKNLLRSPTVLQRVGMGLLASTDEPEPLWEIEAGYDYPTPVCGDWSGEDLPEAQLASLGSGAAVSFMLTGLDYVDDFRLTIEVAGADETFVIDRMVPRDKDGDGFLDWFGATAYFWDYTLTLRVDGYLDPFAGHVDGTWSWEAFPLEDSGVWEADWKHFDYCPVIELSVDPGTGEVGE
ncbi:MAG: hypothetical protein NTW26_05315 [bacterium]|nr:hypothetical protein [bacterium]